MNNLVASNLTHHPGRTAASVVGVAVGVVLVVLTVGLVRGALRDRGQRDHLFCAAAAVPAHVCAAVSDRQDGAAGGGLRYQGGGTPCEAPPTGLEGSQG